MPSVRIQCEHCREWVSAASGGDGTLECDCGSVYAVTVTKLAGADRAKF